MSLCPTINIQLSIMSKWLFKHISTKVSLKLLLGKVMFTLTLVDLEYETCFYLGIQSDDRTKMIVLPSFQLATRLNSQNTNQTEFINELWHIKMFMIFVFPIGIIEVSTWRKCCIWLYFSSLHDYWHPNTWNSLVHTSWSEMDRC